MTFRLRPNATQEKALRDQLRLTRELYNDGLKELIDNYKETGKHLNVFAHQKQHRAIQHPDIPAHLISTTLLRLHRSFENFFRRVKDGSANPGFPRFKSANRWHSLQFRDAVNGCGIRDTYFCAPKKMGGRIRFNRHRDIPGTIKFCRIVRKPSGWYLQVITDVAAVPLPKTGKEIGLDFGITTLVADSDGNKVENPRHLNKSLRKLRFHQRRLAKAQKGSVRRKKKARIVARTHERIANQRRDYLHKTARSYVNRCDVICIENLTPSTMVKTHCLARAITDASWSMLRQLLESKAASAGKEVIAVPPQFTSQRCSSCGEMVVKSLSVRTHLCPHCGYQECRDVNAAKNILRLGQSLRGGQANERTQRTEKPRL